MRIADPTVIAETEEELAARERRLRGQPAAARVRALRLLKAGRAPSLPACVLLVGDRPRQLACWWATYRDGGLAAVTQVRPRPGKVSRLTAEALAGLETEMRAGAIAPLTDVRRYLSERWGIESAGLNGVWWQVRKHRLKLKTGRRRHRKADPMAQAACTAGFRDSP